MYLHTENLEMINSFEIILDKTKHAVAYNQKVLELQKRGLRTDEIENIMLQPIQMEMYYDSETDCVFSVESEAVMNTTIVNPYSHEIIEDSANHNGEIKQSVMVDEINAICSTFGSVQFGELQLDSHTVYAEGEETITFIEGLDVDSFIWVQYNKQTNEEVDSKKEPLEKIYTSEIISELYDIAHSWLDEKQNEEINFFNGDLEFEIEKIKSFDAPISVDMSEEPTFEYPYSLDIEDTSYWYANQKDCIADYNRLKIVCPHFTFK